MADLIDRESAIDAMQEEIELFLVIKPNSSKIVGPGVRCEDVIKILRRLPSAEPERKTGRWIFNRYYTWECSECGESPTKGTGYTQGSDELYAFCPHCGSYNGGDN